VHTTRELALDPFARFARVASDKKPQRPSGACRASHRAHEGAPKARDRLVVERVFSRLSADAVSAKQAMGHMKACERDLPDRHVDDGGIDVADAEGLRRVHLDAKIVPARAETGKVHERVNRARTEIS
jgi:hypothetical protein